METIPEEWIDKLFNCMTDFYGERWTRYFDKNYKEKMYKTIWRNGLHGLSYDEIKYALILCKHHAIDNTVFPPHVLEFFNYAKGIIQPFFSPKQKDSVVSNTEVARYHLDQIKRKVNGYTNLEMQDRLYT